MRLRSLSIALAVLLPGALRAQPVTVGADRLFSEYTHLVRGKRLALVSNHSGRLANGVHLADTLFARRDLTLRVLFGMEYDIRSNDYAARRDAGSTVDSRTGLPKHNLYGEAHRPTREQLGDAQVIVVDIQDVGARFYEHVNILAFVLDAAAEYGQSVVVLDRPNPLSGRMADGFVADSAAFFRFGSYTAIPALHGMTMGELARFYVGERVLAGGRVPRLDVVPMTGWRRTMFYDETGLEWRKPSPNLLTLSSLLAYAGTCLFESVNVSEGRGSDAPFELIGAPWLDHRAAVALLRAQRLDGVAFDTVTFVPTRRAFHGRPPELAGEEVRGIRLRVTDRTVARPYLIGVAMLWAVHRLHADRLEWNLPVLDRLTATPRLLTMLRAGRSPAEIADAWSAEVAQFTQRARPYQLYD